MDQSRNYANVKLMEWASPGQDLHVRFRYIQVRQMFWLVDLELNEGWFADRVRNDMFMFKSVSPEHFNILNVRRGTWREGVSLECIIK